MITTIDKPLVTQNTLWDAWYVQSEECADIQNESSEIVPEEEGIAAQTNVEVVLEDDTVGGFAETVHATADNTGILEGELIFAVGEDIALGYYAEISEITEELASTKATEVAEKISSMSSRKRVKGLKPHRLTITGGDDQFFPTLGKIAGVMFADVNWNSIRTILEPSAGKGDLLLAAVKAFYSNTKHQRYSKNHLEADCIEIDPYLRQILTYNFSNEKIREHRNRHRELERDRWKGNRPHSEKEEYKRLNNMIKGVDGVDMRIIHDDFLSFKSSKRYDLILMNPPFANGDTHLLKALELQKHGGQIICLINAQTILNPYTKIRQRLLRELDAHNAKITFIENAFDSSSSAERNADVDVAIVKVVIPHERRESTIFQRMKQAQQQEGRKYGGKDGYTHEYTDLVLDDFIEAMIAQCHFGRQFKRCIAKN